jgi:hypothetical protein
MLVDSIRDAVICDELQLGQALNQSVAQGTFARFSLLMSLLSDDVRDQPQFERMTKDEPTRTQDLRRRFQLAEPEPLYMDTPSDDTLLRHNQAVQQGDLANSHLEMMLCPPGLTPKSEGLNAEVLNNLSLLNRLKLQALSAPKPEDKPDPEAELPEESALYHVLNDFDYKKPLSVRYYD